MKMPKVSIVMPIYNAEKYLKEAIDSLLNQSYRNIELICVDDGSTDASLQILDQYQILDNRVKILKQENCFAGIARNNGMKQASGDYIMFLDSDDIFSRNMIRSLVRKARQYDPDIIVFGYKVFEENIKKNHPILNKYKSGIFSVNEISSNIFQITRSLPWDKFINRRFLEKTGIQFQGTRTNNDVYFSRMLVAKADNILFVPRRFLYYRIHNSSSLQGSINKSPTDFTDALIAIYQELNRQGLYKSFMTSFENAVVTDVSLHLRKVRSLEDFYTIFSACEKSFFKQFQIKPESDAVACSKYRKTIENLIDGNKEGTLFNLWLETEENSVSIESAPYRVGKFLFKILHIN